MATRRKRLPFEAPQVFREIRQELSDATTQNEVDRQNRLDVQMESLTMGILTLTEFQLQWDKLLERMEAAGCLPDGSRLFRSYMGKLDKQILEGIQNQNLGVCWRNCSAYAQSAQRSCLRRAKMG